MFALQFGQLYWTGKPGNWTSQHNEAAVLSLAHASAVQQEGEKVVLHPLESPPLLTVKCECNGMPHDAPRTTVRPGEALDIAFKKVNQRDGLRVWIEVEGGGFLNKTGFSIFKEEWRS